MSPKYSSLNEKNTVAIQYQYKKRSEETYSELQNIQSNTENILELDNSLSWDIKVNISDKLGKTTYVLSVGAGVPVFFVDRLKNSVGINCFPIKNNSIESNGLVLDDIMYIGNQQLYPNFTTSEIGTTTLLGAYNYRLIDGILTGITIPTGYERAYRITAQIQTSSSNTVTIYINNISTKTAGTWSGDTFRTIISSRIFKESEIVLEPTYNYTAGQGINLKVENTDSYYCNVYAITLHGYLMKSTVDTSTIVIPDDIPTGSA